MRPRKGISLAAAILGIPLAATAAVNDWSTLGPNGGEVIKVVYNRDTPDTVYMIAAAGFLRSVDAGATWQLVKNDFLNAPSDLDVDPTDQRRVYVVSPSPQTLIVSTDAGASFTAVSSFPNVGNVWQLEVAPDGQTLYAVSALRVFRSQDRGTTWHERTALGSGPGVPNRLLAHPTDKETVYAITPTAPPVNALQVTHDGGGSWTQLATAPPTGFLYDVAIPASNPARIWLATTDGVRVSSNSGSTFSPPAPLPNGDAAVVIAINPADATNLFVGGSAGAVFRTTNDGGNWVDVTDDITTSFPRSIALRPAQTLPHVLVGGFGGLSLSTLGGTNWTPREAGFVGTRVLGLSADPTSDRVYLNESSGGVHYVAGGASNTTSVNNTNLRQLAQTPTSLHVPAVLAQDGSPGRLLASLDFRIASSIDGGNNWTLTNFPTLPGHQVIALTSSPGNPQVVLAGVTSSVVRSTNGGTDWTAATVGLPAGAFTSAVAFAPSDPLIAYVAPQTLAGPSVQSFGVYRSTNAGQSWSAANTGIESLAVAKLVVDPTDAQTVYISADSKLWRSTNGGTSWSQRPWPTDVWGFPSAIAVDPVHPEILFATGPFVVARSIDRGEAWELLRQPQASPGWVPDVVLPDPRRPHVLFVGTVNSGLQQMTISPDLSVELDAPASPLPIGMEVTYRYTVFNLGPFHATGVKLALQIPASAQSVSIQPSAGTCTTPGPAITCSFGPVRAGFTATVTLRATPSATGAFPITAAAEADQPDTAAGNNTQTRDATVAQVSDLSVTATGPASAQTGSALTHSLTVTNSGPNAATQVELDYQLASGLTPGTVTTSVGSCSVNAARVTCNLGTLTVAATATISVNATAASAGAQASTATVTTTAHDNTAANNSASLTTNVTAPPTSSGGGGGGGGSLSVCALLLLALIVANRAGLSWRWRS
jgi:uncharacterized repeat protein (TIGR01451 family)